MQPIKLLKQTLSSPKKISKIPSLFKKKKNYTNKKIFFFKYLTTFAVNARWMKVFNFCHNKLTHEFLIYFETSEWSRYTCQMDSDSFN